MAMIAQTSNGINQLTQPTQKSKLGANPQLEGHFPIHHASALQHELENCSEPKKKKKN